MNKVLNNISHAAHVGLPKTATTFLQKQFFNSIKGPFYSTDPSSIWPEELNWIRTINYYWFEDFYSKSICWKRKEREERFAQKVAIHEASWVNSGKEFIQEHKEPVLLSAEGLSGFSCPMANAIGLLLKGIGINKIIFVFRNQRDWSYSLWKQLVITEDRFARLVMYDDLFLPLDDELQVDMEWDRYLDIYRLIFGEKNVLALPYELLKADPSLFFEYICIFLNKPIVSSPDIRVRENVSNSESSYISLKTDNIKLFSGNYTLRLLTHKLAKKWLGLTKKDLPQWVVKKHYFLDEGRVNIMQMYENSNCRLSSMTGIDLSHYGYY